MIYDFCVVGGGIVGLATALKILEMRPSASLVLLEKETELARHQTGHNSGVIHAGVYYKAGSLKAELCRTGLRETKDFCSSHSIPFEECGKLIVATNEKESGRLDDLLINARQNGLDPQVLGRDALRELEPNIVGEKALLVRETGIVDYARISFAIADDIRAMGGTIKLNTELLSIVETGAGVELVATDGSYNARQAVLAGGLQSDRLARMAGLHVDFRIIPFRGEYYRLPADKSGLIHHLIYPAPDPSMPFLGIHLTRMIDGSITVGPNAVLGWAREGYAKGSLNLRDSLSTITYPGFWRLVAGNLAHVGNELRSSLFKQSYLEACRRYCPSLGLDDLLPYRAGIRAQAVTGTGQAIHDFLFAETNRVLVVCNAPSPAATSSLPIGATIARKCIELAN